MGACALLAGDLWTWAAPALAADAPPALTVPGAQSAVVNTPLPIAGVSVSDVDAVAASQTLTVTISDSHGLLSATAAAGGTVTGSGTTTLTIKGQLAQVNGDLATLGYSRATTGADLITLTANDGDGGTAPKKTIAITAAATAATRFGQEIASLGAIGTVAGPLSDWTMQKFVASPLIHAAEGVQACHG